MKYTIKTIQNMQVKLFLFEKKNDSRLDKLKKCKNSLKLIIIKLVIYELIIN